MPKRGRLEQVPLGPGAYMVIAREVTAAVVDFQPGDRSTASAPARAISVKGALDRGDRVAPPSLRVKPNGRFEVWDGNARVTAFREMDRPFDAVVVTDLGAVERLVNSNETVPRDPELWTELVAEVRSAVDAERVAFRWPSPEAEDWVLREYLAAGGRFGRQRAPRPPRMTQRREVRAYQALFAGVDTAEDLYSLAEILGRARELGSPVLRGTMTKKVVERARRMGFRCPARGGLERCGDQLLKYAATRQGVLFNPRTAKRRLMGRVR